ncbi:RagB/SusD family nutrient uptake outer membrane protein [Sinomicrobium weinanense]|uniref:RagB/SusD family nutrient uptake outer membrane protein n=1 Tax=Sinomicrobium weinanense TaxID=2842200 RepID=A0A926JVK6_9FLAO|nr:RagB/SusD family nutrient uptake outer membrane protein [Sinomicrobium weinanense]MBC9797997.1 RagB/SusD family nutrient uptake outer membrane protein [Sinomicrobium weinanense]MBU3125588.1 RagB/SusD family nutrient uptake outer membrane protein [Sinomicrobium weinanense]
MKVNIKLLIYPVIATALFSACDDFLDKEPLSQPSSEIFWKTETDVNAALAATYSIYRTNIAGSVAGSNGVSINIECLSDNAISESGFFGIQNIMHGGIHSGTGGAVQDFWRLCYEGIANCNYFLDNIDQAKDFLSEESYNQYKGEALFNRCYFYNELIQLYGDVPLLLHSQSIDSMEVFKNKPRVPKPEVVEQLLKDIDIAISGLPNIAYTDGHAVKGSAILLKVRILMNNERWAEAAEVAWSLIGDAGNPFSLHDNYSGIFFDEQEDNPEIMFSVQYQLPSDGHQLDQYIGSRMSFYPTTQLRDAYEIKDPETGEMDPRLGMTIFQEGDPWIMHPSGKFPAFENDEGRTSEGNVNFTGMAFKKWVNPTLIQARDKVSDQDIVKMRYAELLLSYAEAMFESGQGTDQRALDAINAVRQRPGVEMPPLSVLTRENIRNERRIELAFEGLRFNDLKRWQIAHEIIPEIPGNGADVQRVFDGYLWPIPQSQMDIMEGIWEQNPGF